MESVRHLLRGRRTNTAAFCVQTAAIARNSGYPRILLLTTTKSFHWSGQAASLQVGGDLNSQEWFHSPGPCATPNRPRRDFEGWPLDTV